jgi:DNA recombination protein RmuC
MEPLSLFIGICLGGVIGFLLARLRLRSGTGATEEEARLRETLDEAGRELAATRERARQAETRNAEWRAELAHERERREHADERSAEREAQNARLSQALESERKASGERLAELAAARDQLADTFRAAAGQLLAETREQGIVEQRERLAATLGPFETQLQGFRALVEKTYSEELRDRAALKHELGVVARQHQELSAEARRLSEALTGSSKVRGDWGEITLTRILEKSGLREGHEYLVQASTTLDDGTRLRPDVVIRLPQDGILVVDSKLQLVSWLQCAEAATPEEAARAGAALATAMRGHIRELDRKAYASLYEDAVELVVMYVPVEAAILAALAADPGLFEDAWGRGVVLCGPSMLMAMLLGLAQQWRARHQDRNVLKIARVAEQLGKKLETFLESYRQLGSRLRQGAQAYNDGLNQLAEGKGNVLRRAAELGELGVRSAAGLGVDWEKWQLEPDDDPDVLPE